MTTTTTTTPRHPWRPLLGLLLLAILGFLGIAEAGFTNSFDNLAGGATVELSWDPVPRESYPLVLRAQVIERTGDADKVNMFVVNVTSIPTDATTAFLWTNAPYPLRYVPRGGMYRVELLSSSSSGVLARSPTFDLRERSKTGGSGPAPTLIDYQSAGSPGVNRPLAIGLGVAVGIPSVVALGIVSWCFRRRQRRKAEMRRRRRRMEFVIN